MITQRCKDTTCNAEFTPDAQHRYGGYCSSACARRNTKPPVFTGSRKPNTSLTVLGKPAVNRMHGTDRKVQS